MCLIVLWGARQAGKQGGIILTCPKTQENDKSVFKHSAPFLTRRNVLAERRNDPFCDLPLLWHKDKALCTGFQLLMGVVQAGTSPETQTQIAAFIGLK